MAFVWYTDAYATYAAHKCGLLCGKKLQNKLHVDYLVDFSIAENAQN